MRRINSKLILIFFCFILFFPPVFSQKKFDASLGFGLPEFAFLKLRYGGDFKVGLSHGYFKAEDVSNKTWDLSFYYCFGRDSKFSGDRIWYVMTGGDYMLRKFYEEEKNDEAYGLYLRIGRTINFSDKLGINLDIGPGALFFEDNNAVGSLMGSACFFVRF